MTAGKSHVENLRITSEFVQIQLVLSLGKNKLVVKCFDCQVWFLWDSWTSLVL